MSRPDAPQEDGYTIRAGQGDDLSFVLKCWVDDYRGSDFAYGCRKADIHYLRFQDMIAKNILGRADLAVACWDKDPD